MFLIILDDKDQAMIPNTANKVVSSLPEAASYLGAVKQFLKSVVREIRTLHCVGIGGG
jgi:hypothetical protein